MASIQYGFGVRIHWFRVGRQIRVKKVCGFKNIRIRVGVASIFASPRFRFCASCLDSPSTRIRYCGFQLPTTSWRWYTGTVQRQYPSKQKVVLRLLSAISLSNTVFKNIRFQSSTRIRQNRRIQKQKSTLEGDLKKTRFRWPHSLVSCGRKADSSFKKYIRFQYNYYRDSCGRGLT